MKAILVKIVLWLVTLPYSVNQEKIATPPNYKIFVGGVFPKTIEDSLVKAYQEVFGEDPWNEKWSKGDVRKKIKKDLAGDPNSFLAVFLNQAETEVLGFSWGSIIFKNEILSRANTKIPVSSSRIIYCDEFAIVKKGRGGIEPVRNLVKMFLEYGYKKGVKSTIFWSTPASKIVPLAEMMGYRICHRVEKSDKDIVFLLNDSTKPLLKLTKNIPQRRIAQLMRRLK